MGRVNTSSDLGRLPRPPLRPTDRRTSDPSSPLRAMCRALELFHRPTRSIATPCAQPRASARTTPNKDVRAFPCKACGGLRRNGGGVEQIAMQRQVRRAARPRTMRGDKGRRLHTTSPHGAHGCANMRDKHCKDWFRNPCRSFEHAHLFRCEFTEPCFVNYDVKLVSNSDEQVDVVSN